MTISNLALAFQAIEKLTLDELRAFVPQFNAHIKQKSKVEMVKKAASTIASNSGTFVHGNILTWTSTKRATYGKKFYIKMTGFNRAGSHAVGFECDDKGNQLGVVPMKWTVPLNMLSLHIPK